jgi:hypothetical protein
MVFDEMELRAAGIKASGGELIGEAGDLDGITDARGETGPVRRMSEDPPEFIDRVGLGIARDSDMSRWHSIATGERGQLWETGPVFCTVETFFFDGRNQNVPVQNSGGSVAVKGIYAENVGIAHHTISTAVGFAPPRIQL